MGVSCLYKVSLVSLVVMIALFYTQAAPAPVSAEQAEDKTNILSHVRQCLESLKSKEPKRVQHGNTLGESDSSDTVSSQTSSGEECETLLAEFIANSDTGNRQKLVESPFKSSFSSTALSEKVPTRSHNGEEDIAVIPVRSSKGGKLSREDIAGQGEALSRRSRDISSADRKMILSAHGVISRMLASRGFGHSDQGSSRGISDDALLLKLARDQVLAELKKDLLHTNGHMGIASLIKPISHNPSVALRQGVPPKLKQSDDRGLVNALTIDAGLDEEDTSFSRSQDTGENSDYSSRGIKRGSNTLSVNNAMMAITNMLLAEQKERLQRNRQRIRQHMLIQG